jgi:carbonic anhydrase
MPRFGSLLENNRRWADAMRAQDPSFFQRLSEQQAPDYLWIGCADSRVPANQIVGLMPGELFVHRNVANVVLHADLNCMSVLQFAIEVLRVEQVIVCGHYVCGGVRAALDDARLGLVDHWIRHVRDVAHKHAEDLASLRDEGRRWNRLCELNVIEQAGNVCQTTMVQDAWKRGQPVSVHALVYGVGDGLLRELSAPVTGPAGVPSLEKAARSLRH